MRLTSTTIVKNGMPFIGLALRIALPHVDQMIITISAKADEATIKEVFSLRDPKVEIYWEDIEEKGELTRIENEQFARAKGEWIWMIDDDELWPEEDLLKVFTHFREDIDSISINPFQVLDSKHHEASFRDKSFSKFFKRKGVRMIVPFPRNRLAKNGKLLNWRYNKRTLKVPYKYFHMPLVKEYSFRNEPRWKQYVYRKSTPIPIPDEYIEKLNGMTKGIVI